MSANQHNVSTLAAPEFETFAVESSPRVSTPKSTERPLAAWIHLAALGLLAALALPFLLGRVYVADDLGEFHLPLRNFYAEQLRAGERFDWMPNLFGGFYVTGEGQLGGYHPLHAMLYRWLPLGAAFDLELLVSYPLLFGGMVLFLRRWLQRSDAALFGALAFTFCGFNLLHFVHPNAVAIVAHLPWMLLAIELSLTVPAGPRRAVAELGLGLLAASQLLLGYPQYVWLTWIVATMYAVWRAVSLHAPLARVGMLIFAVSAGVLTAGIQLLPTVDALLTSNRATADAEFAATGSLHPLNIVQFVGPYLFQTRVVGQNTHELGLYAGAVPLLLCLWLVTRHDRWGNLKPFAWAAIVLAVSGFLLAMGEAGGLYRLQAFIPGANRFRFPCRAIVLVQFAMALGAAVAMAILLRPTGADDLARRKVTVRLLLTTFGASVALALIGPLVWPEFVASPVLVWTGPLTIGIGATLVLAAERQFRGAWVALVLFTAVDLGAYGLSYAVDGRTADLHEFVGAIPTPPGAPMARVAAPDDHGLRTGDRMLLAGLSRVDGYAGLEPAKRLDYTTEPALRRAGAEYVRQVDQDEPARTVRWQPIANPAARARLVTRITADDKLSDRKHDSLDTVSAEPTVELEESSPGVARVTTDRPGRLAIETETAAAQLLVMTESYHAGWLATIDGQVAPVVRVDGDFLGVVVSAGKQVVRLDFHPDSLRLGAWMSACGLGLLLCVFGFRLGPRRSTARP